ncbi:T9SS type A sorting domain-containing protein [Calditrichota bacterium]
MFVADPLFANADSGDFHLSQGSPLINAGDPDSPDDPDGSRADVGVFPYDPDYVGIEEELDLAELPASFQVEGPYPNPFNSTVKYQINIPTLGELAIDIINIEGRIVESMDRHINRPGVSEISLDLHKLSTGLYFIRFKSKNNIHISKAVLIQ